MHGFTNEGRSAMMPESVLYAFSVMSDKEAQEDELVALASIYDKDIFSISSDQEGEREIPGGEFCANLDLPQPFYVHLQATPQKGMDWFCVFSPQPETGGLIIWPPSVCPYIRTSVDSDFSEVCGSTILKLYNRCVAQERGVWNIWNWCYFCTARSRCSVVLKPRIVLKVSSYSQENCLPEHVKRLYVTYILKMVWSCKVVKLTQMFAETLQVHSNIRCPVICYLSLT